MKAIQVIAILAVVVAVIAATIDVRRAKIPNRLTYPALLAGVALQSVFHGWRGFLSSLGGAAFFGGLFVVFFAVRAMGAGDVKLAAAIGSIVGWPAILPVMMATAISGAALAFFFVATSGRILMTLRNTLRLVGFHLSHGLKVHPTLSLESPTSVRMPYGLAFAVGTLFWAVSSHLGR